MEAVVQIADNRPRLRGEEENQTHSSRSAPRAASKNSASYPLDLMRTALLPRGFIERKRGLFDFPSTAMLSPDA